MKAIHPLLLKGRVAVRYHWRDGRAQRYISVYPKGWIGTLERSIGRVAVESMRHAEDAGLWEHSSPLWSDGADTAVEYWVRNPREHETKPSGAHWLSSGTE